MLGRRRRRRANNKTALGQCIVFAGYTSNCFLPSKLLPKLLLLLVSAKTALTPKVLKYNLNFHPLEDQQLQVGENYSYFVKFETKHFKILMFL